jgi:hypothetical protein
VNLSPLQLKYKAVRIIKYPVNRNDSFLIINFSM